VGFVQSQEDTMATETHGAAEQVAMPQLDFATFPNQIFWLLVTLVVIYFVLSKVALPRISSVLAERSGTIMNDISAAEELKLKAKDAENAYNQALAEAKAEAQRISGEANVAIQADLDVALANEIRENAADSVKVVAKDTAKELIAAFGGKADAKTLTAAINARLKG
jgi:F-type H+-transporting ATPase subunit b